MISTDGLGPVSAAAINRIADLLDERRVVAWYDGERAFAELVAGLDSACADERIALVDACKGRLYSRRAADDAMRALGPSETWRGLLLYLPFARGRSEDQRRGDIFEAFARVGMAFGDEEHAQLEAIARDALSNQTAVLEPLFANGKPTLAVLDRLGGVRAGSFMLVRQALGSDDAVTALATAIASSDLNKRLAAIPGAQIELERLASESLGLLSKSKESPASFQKRLSAFVLLGELSKASGEGWPGALAAVPRAEGIAADTAALISASLRNNETSQAAYRAAAESIENDHRLTHVFSDAAASILGAEIFRFQERNRLAAVVRSATVGALADARALLDAGRQSLWRRDEDRRSVWTAVERQLEFLENASRLSEEPQFASMTVAQMIDAYAAPDGWHLLDQAQRAFEHAAAAVPGHDEIQDLLEHCLARYLALIEPRQTRFLQAVTRFGWPPEGTHRQTQTFNGRVEPVLQDEQRRVAYFLVDSLRYEMAADLALALADLGEVQIEAAATALPSATMIGMAALLPGADGGLRLVKDGATLVPAIGDARLPDWSARYALIKRRFGDRVDARTLEEILSAKPDRLGKQLAKIDLVIVRSLEIDDDGEGRSDLRARQSMSSILGSLKTAVRRLIESGFDRFVIAADHGHMFMPEARPGDVVPSPNGEWLLSKRRALVGRRTGVVTGAIVFPAADVGILSDEAGLELVVPDGFRTYRGGEAYFHEGVSLQESVVPVLTLHAFQASPALYSADSIVISYRAKYFTAPSIGLKLMLHSMLTASANIALYAYDTAHPKGEPVGQAADCDAVDPVTGEVHLEANAETHVQLTISRTVEGGAIEVRAIEPSTGVILGRLTLKDSRIEP